MALMWHLISLRACHDHMTQTLKYHHWGLSVASRFVPHSYFQVPPFKEMPLPGFFIRSLFWQIFRAFKNNSKFLAVQSLTLYQHGHYASLLEYFTSIYCFCLLSHSLVSSWKSSSNFLVKRRLLHDVFWSLLFYTQHLLLFLVTAWMNCTFACLLQTCCMFPNCIQGVSL